MRETSLDSTISFHKREGSFFVKVYKDLGHGTLGTLRELLALASDDNRLFLDLRSLHSISEQEKASLRDILSSSAIPQKSIFFKGEMGFAVAVDGNKVLISRKKEAGMEPNAKKVLAAHGTHQCKCCGKCRTCGHHGHEALLAS